MVIDVVDLERHEVFNIIDDLPGKQSRVIGVINKCDTKQKKSSDWVRSASRCTKSRLIFSIRFLISSRIGNQESQNIIWTRAGLGSEIELPQSKMSVTVRETGLKRHSLQAKNGTRSILID